MSKVSFDKMSIKQIDDLIAEAQAAKVHKQAAKKVELRDMFAKQAAEAGFSLAELAGRMKAAKRTGKFTYKNPTNPSQTWSGMGRKPLWLQAAEKSGKSLDSFRA